MASAIVQAHLNYVQCDGTQPLCPVSPVFTYYAHIQRGHRGRQDWNQKALIPLGEAHSLLMPLVPNIALMSGYANGHSQQVDSIAPTLMERSIT